MTTGASANALAALDGAIASLAPEERGPFVVGLAARVAAIAAEMAPVPARVDQGADRNLSVEEAAERLGMSTAWLYRNGRRLGFAVRLGRRLLFSERGLERHLERRRGQP